LPARQPRSRRCLGRAPPFAAGHRAAMPASRHAGPHRAPWAPSPNRSQEHRRPKPSRPPPKAPT